MIYIWCYALCRELHTLNHTDAKALVVCRHVRLWHWCGLGGLLVYSYLKLSTGFAKEALRI